MPSSINAISMFQTELQQWGKSNRRAFPWRSEVDPFRTLVTEILVQRSRSSTVENVYRELFARWPDAEALSRAQVRSIEVVMRPLGLISRARRLKELARAVVELGGVPRDALILASLPGVGPYAANATVAAAFGRRSPTVDGVSARVYRRYFGLAAAGPAVSDRALWDLVSEVTPTKGARTWNWAVLDFAAAICLPKVPRCDRCPLRSTCAYVRHA